MVFSMQILLTHEQADFDALASLLGAWMLNESAIPVLPRRVNRNVGAFLTLYGVDFPFVDPRDLPNQTVEAATLVDTQSMVSIKGMGPWTQVSVIDHHPQRDNLPDDWSILRDEIGATTTLIVEMLEEQNLVPDVVQATLLLLGIYEDTGSLTYARTTARDLRAAAFLLDHGANLHIAANFLNHPLSAAQQVIYDQLRSNAEYHNIHGHRIVIATGDAQEMEEELSTIVHKLRDLLDPDAIFVLVKTRGGVQMIARSTTDHIDVGACLARFGGGGHERAAAGLVRENKLEELRQELVQELPDHVRPAITVAQIMSRGAQVLSPWTPVEEAAEKMRRFGYEGYPVVQNGKIVGLLTRRAVDRALSHNLRTTATSLMDAGSYAVHPEDSVEHLQRLMTDSGWGQVPVQDPLSGEIIGIVTRTDLIKTLADQPRLVTHPDLAGRLEAALPAQRLQLLKAIAHEATSQHQALYIVGGFVRDLWLNQPSLDFDLVVEGDAIKLAHSLVERYGGRVTSHSRFGTAKWHLDGSQFEPTGGAYLQNNHNLQSVDLVTARTEFYTYPTALPTVERGSIKLDLHRRDFTINTLALRLDGHHYGELLDYWGGINDLRQGVVRVLHSLSFIDDPTRMLRAVRFEQRFGFKIDKRTMQLLKEAIELLGRVSGDRIRHELNNILIEPRVSAILSRLDKLDMLKNIHPALRWDAWLDERFNRLPDEMPTPEWQIIDEENIAQLRRSLAYMIWLMRLPKTEIVEICERFKMPVSLREDIQAAAELWQEVAGLVNLPPSEIVARLDLVSRLALFAVFKTVDNDDERDIISKYIQKWQSITPTITGHGLRKLGIPPGPDYRFVLEALRAAWLDDKISSHEEEQILLNRLLKKGK